MRHQGPGGSRYRIARLVLPSGYGEFDIGTDAVEAETGVLPKLSTSGGTSDARFIKDACPVCEFGMVGQTMHKTDERAAVKDINDLAATYGRILDGFFKAA
mgnify:CR=1 FL=1